ncbi:MAG: aldehyde dehydrogenase family protein [Thermoplasmatota archaeon]
MRYRMESYGMYIDGKWTEATDDRFDSIDPTTGETLARFPSGTLEDVERAVSAAHNAFEEWQRTPAPRRGEMLLDARPPNMYEGQAPWRKPGHIPGAVNLPWKSLMQEGNPMLLKTDDDIATVLDEKGISKDMTIICSCGTGREATNEFLLFKWYLGYPNVHIYEGSFTEWTSHPENPTVTGPNPY